MTLVLLVGQIVFGSSMVQGTVCPERGGELCSLRVRHRGEWVETLYRAMDFAPAAGWQGRAPWLWPATGKGDPLPMHGFARTLPWKVVAQSADGVSVTLSDTPETRALYPYGFLLRADFSAPNKNEISIRFRVEASKDNQAPMPFTAGNHITFRTPLLAGSDPLAMTLETPSGVEYLKENGAPTGESAARSLARPVLLRDFDATTAVSLGRYAGEPFMVLRDPGGLAVRISHGATETPSEPLVRFNMWGDPGHGYFSPEPWVGLQDSQRLQMGLIRLAAGRSWDWRIRISFFDKN